MYLLAYEMGVTELEATQVLVVARCLCDVFRALINSLVYWFDENTKTHITRYALQASGSVASMSDRYLKEETSAVHENDGNCLEEEEEGGGELEKKKEEEENLRRRRRRRRT